ncbi:MAG: phosphoribosylamine--glycine ligase, partial [bacterium]
MKILLVGNGGRENAIAWKICSSRSFMDTNSLLINTIGNPGIEEFAETINIKATEIDLLVDYALKENIDFTIVGPEVPLSLGIVNKFSLKGLKIFGPTMEAAEIESSKIFSKRLMVENDIPTAKYKNFSIINLEEACNFLKLCTYPVVIKADGLAGGKGVVIAWSLKESLDTVKEFSNGSSFDGAGSDFIIEEYLEGEEISVFVITDGTDYIVLPYSQDHKKILDGDNGKNTGGMGAIAPVRKFQNQELENKINKKIIEPVLRALKDEGREFKGCLYCGLIITHDDPYVIEFNCRFGDPETQAVLPLIESDFLEMLIASA